MRPFGERCLALLGVFTFAGTLEAGTPIPRMLLLDAAVVGSDVFAVGERGSILRSTDNAQSWSRLASPVRSALTGISFPPETLQRGWAVGHDAVILATVDGGLSWRMQFQADNREESFLDVLALNNSHVLAVGAYGLFYVTTDGGQTWVRKNIREGDEHLNRLSHGPSGVLYLAGERGTLLRSVDAGDSWQPIKSPYQGSFYGIVPLDRRTLLAYGLEGRVFRSIDEGLSWQAVPTPRPVLLATAAQLKSNYIYLSGYAKTLLLSKDYGKSFAAVDSPPPKGVAELVELPDGSVLALGDGGVTVLPRPW